MTTSHVISIFKYEIISVLKTIHPGIINTQEYKKENNIPNNDKRILLFTFLNMVFNNIGTIDQPININITNSKLKDPLKILSNNT